MTTQWLWRIYLFIRSVDNTAQNRTDFAEAFVNNASMETVVNERKLFDAAVRFSVTGDEPATALGINTAAKKEMRDDLKIVLDNLTNARYAVVANIAHGSWEEHELALTNFPGVTPSGQIVSWQTALTFLENEFGLQVIPSEEI